jgi:hypothetical protein
MMIENLKIQTSKEYTMNLYATVFGFVFVFCLYAVLVYFCASQAQFYYHSEGMLRQRMNPEAEAAP